MMEYVILTLIGFVLAALLGRLIIPRILIISLRKRLYDLPDFRKVHNRPVSRLGGVTFFPAIVLVLCTLSMFQLHSGGWDGRFFSDNILSEMLCLIIGLMLLYIIGICDDLIGVRYSRKLLVQLLAALFIPLAGLYINHSYGLFGLYEISPWVGVPLTILFTVFITNAINLIDGIDGLASVLCMMILVFFGVSFAVDGLWVYALLAFVCLGVLVPFFLYNVFGDAEHGSKIFMGDTGSLTLGFILSLMSVKYIMYIGTSGLALDGTPVVLLFSLLLVPCLDVCRVVLVRLYHKNNPFKPDKSHIHHKFLSMGFTPRRSLLFIGLMSAFFIVLTALLLHVGVLAHVVLIVDVLLWTLMNVWFSRIIRKRNFYVANVKI